LITHSALQGRLGLLVALVQLERLVLLVLLVRLVPQALLGQQGYRVFLVLPQRLARRGRRVRLDFEDLLGHREFLDPRRIRVQLGELVRRGGQGRRGRRA